MSGFADVWLNDHDAHVVLHAAGVEHVEKLGTISCPLAAAPAWRGDAAPSAVDYRCGWELSSTDGGRQAMSATNSVGTGNRIEPRRVRIPLLPVELQETYGSAFRRLAEFTRSLRTAHDLGCELARNSADAIAVALSSVADDVGTQVSSVR